MSHSHTLLIADLRSEWARSIADELGPLHRVFPRWLAGDITEALTTCRDAPPEMVLVLQETPDQYAVQDIHRLLACWPLTRFVVCHGPWCLGDGRNRDRWPLAMRVPFTDLASRLDQEELVLSASAASLPWTASRDEMARQEMIHYHPPPDHSFTFHILSPDPAWILTLESQLQTLCGQSTHEAPADLLVVDIDPWLPSSPHQLETWHLHWVPRASVLLTSTPHAIPAAELADATTACAATGTSTIRLHGKLEAAARPSVITVPLHAPRIKKSA